MTLQTFLYILASGVVLGSLYALMAVGLAVIWTTLGIFNFSHGLLSQQVPILPGKWPMLTVGASVYPSLLWRGLWVFSPSVYFFKRFLSGHLRKKTILCCWPSSPLWPAPLCWKTQRFSSGGGRSKQLPRVIEGNVSLFGVTISAHEGLIILLVPVLIFLLWFLFHKTHLGLAMRAVAQNREAGELMGLNVQRLYLLAFGISAGLAGLAGVFLGSIRFITPTMGNEPLMKALIVVIFGGIARLSSPVKAAYVIGIIKAFSIYFIGLYWAPTVLFIVIIAVLMIKPEGLFGKFERIIT